MANFDPSEIFSLAAHALARRVGRGEGCSEGCIFGGISEGRGIGLVAGVHRGVASSAWVVGEVEGRSVGEVREWCGE